jgi:hypothetical protein
MGLETSTAELAGVSRGGAESPEEGEVGAGAGRVGKVGWMVTGY